MADARLGLPDAALAVLLYLISSISAIAARLPLAANREDRTRRSRGVLARWLKVAAITGSAAHRDAAMWAPYVGLSILYVFSVDSVRFASAPCWAARYALGPLCRRC